MEVKKSTELFYWTISVISVAATFFSTVLIIFKYLGLLNLHIEGIENYINAGRITEPADFITFSIILISLKMIIKRKLDVYSIIMSKTRSSIIIIILIVFELLFILYKVSEKKKSIMLVMLFLPIAALIERNRILQIVLNLFNERRKIGITFRFDELNYFVRHIFDNIFFGMGIIGQRNTTYYGVLHGDRHNYYLSDIGILGFICVFGIVGLGLMIYLIASMIIITKNQHNMVIRKCDYILMYYFAMTSILTSMLDIQRIIILTFYLVIFDTINSYEIGEVINE